MSAMSKTRMPELPHLVKPSGRGGSWPVLGGAVEIWEADFIDRERLFAEGIGTDRTQWPPQEERDLIIEFPVRRGECPNDEAVLWDYARQHLANPFRGNLRRIR